MPKTIGCLLALSLALAAGCSQLSQSTHEQVAGFKGVSSSLARDVGEFQRGLIRERVTGSNVVAVGQVGESGARTLYRRAVNSGRPGDRDIDGSTLFPIWSMSKPITIVAMMTLHEKGRVKWDDPVAKYIPCFNELKVRDGSGLRPAKTTLLVEHLMTHRSGYGYYIPMDGMPSEGLTNPPSYHTPHPSQTRFDDLQQFCEAVAAYPLAFDPGTQYLYGINQAILGRLVEVLSGMSFAAYLDKTIFGPLGMTRTSFVLDAERRRHFQPLYIKSGNLEGFTDLLNELTYTPRSRAHFGGEGLVSCLDDYIRFCEMLANEGRAPNGHRVIAKESIAAMTTVHSKRPFGAMMPGADMGYSVFVMTDPAAEGCAAPPGLFGWSGYHNTHFWIDPKNRLYGLFMTRAREFSFAIPSDLRAVVYGRSPR